MYFIGVVLGIGVAVVLAMYFLGASGILLERLLSRFETLDSVDALRNFSRIYEVKVAWHEAPWRVRIFGGGSLYYHYSGVTGFLTDELHIGWAKLYLKGGVVAVFFFVWIFLENFRKAVRCFRRPSFAIGVTLPVFVALGLSHSTIFGARSVASFSVALSLFLFPALYSLENDSRRILKARLHQLRTCSSGTCLDKVV